VASKAYLAFDLGAESGRALLARLRSGVLDVEEVHRFSNIPVTEHHSLRWNVGALWQEIRAALDRLHAADVVSIGVDTWGVDYALLDRQGELLQNPYHYRDHRNAAAMSEVLRRVPKEEIYGVTGIQFMPINTVNQLFAARQHTPELLDAADRFVMMPDLFNYWLTGNIRSEYTDASTSQLIDPRTRTWALGLMERLDIPTRLAPPLVEPGTLLGPLRPGVTSSSSSSSSSGLRDTVVVAVGSHDTASAVAAVTAREDTVFLSSGTWSLIGMEVDAPVLSQRAMQLNFSNEGGVAGTTRLLKNVMGLWLLQGCRRSWLTSGTSLTYAELAAAAEREAAFAHLVDPDDPTFSNPDDMLQVIDRFCARTDQPAPASIGAYTRTVLESLALKYRLVIRDLEALIGRKVNRVRVIGGGSQNALLNQFTADALGVTVIAGPVEATAVGNVAVQLLATGEAASLEEARRIIERSFPTTTFEPRDMESWNRQSARFQQYCGLLYA
jgi:rhamnulokinase